MDRQEENKYLKCNLHTHTVYSDGEGTVEENIQKAIEKGFISIGISDHSVTDFDSTYCMKRENEIFYREEIRVLREKYKDAIEVYCGLELDGYSECDRSLYDYTIGSCHYIKTSDGYFSVDHCREGHAMLFENYFDSDPILFAKAYFDTIAERTVVQRPDIIGHFDLVSKFGFMNETSDEYLRIAKESLAVCLGVTPFIEINSGTMARGIRSVPYPAPYLLPEIKALGGKVLLSSDSHKCNNLDYAFDNSISILKACGFCSITVLKNGEFCEIGIG